MRENKDDTKRKVEKKWRKIESELDARASEA